MSFRRADIDRRGICVVRILNVTRPRVPPSGCGVGIGGGGFISPFAAGARGQAAPGVSMVDVAREYGAARQGCRSCWFWVSGEKAGSTPWNLAGASGAQSQSTPDIRADFGPPFLCLD